MNIRGRIKNGVVVLESGPVPPEGTAVTVSCEPPPPEGNGRKRRRVSLPLVPSHHPGTVALTADRVAELLD